jgi:hypothetical protein
MNNKAIETLKSRKFWITILVSIMSIALFISGQIDIDKMLEIIRWAAGIYVGGLSVEDGFKKLLPIVHLVMDGKYTK